MTREETLQRFCGLVNDVGMKVYNYTLYMDCFCGRNSTFNSETCKIDPEIIAFIENAVHTRIENIKIGRKIKDLEDAEKGFNRPTLSSLLREW